MNVVKLYIKQSCGFCKIANQNQRVLNGWKTHQQVRLPIWHSSTQTKRQNVIRAFCKVNDSKPTTSSSQFISTIVKSITLSRAPAFGVFAQTTRSYSSVTLIAGNAPKLCQGRAASMMQTSGLSSSVVLFRLFGSLANSKRNNSGLVSDRAWLYQQDTKASRLLFNTQLQHRRLASSQSAGTHWLAERALSVALIPTTPLAFMYPNVLTNVLFSTVLVAHIHLGFDAIVVDYVRPAMFGETISKVAIGSVYVLTALTFFGLLYLNVVGKGFVQTIKKLWKK